MRCLANFKILHGKVHTNVKLNFQNSFSWKFWEKNLEKSHILEKSRKKLKCFKETFWKINKIAGYHLQITTFVLQYECLPRAQWNQCYSSGHFMPVFSIAYNHLLCKHRIIGQLSTIIIARLVKILWSVLCDERLNTAERKPHSISYQLYIWISVPFYPQFLSNIHGFRQQNCDTLLKHQK